MTKQLSGWEMLKRINAKCKIFVNTFSGATAACMEDYMKPLRMSLISKVLIDNLKEVIETLLLGSVI